MPGETKMASLIWKIEWYKYISFPFSSFYSVGRSQWASQPVNLNKFVDQTASSYLSTKPVQGASVILSAREPIPAGGSYRVDQFTHLTVFELFFASHLSDVQKYT